MAKINLPKLGSIEDISTAAAVLLVCVLVFGALVGLTIWKGDDSTDTPPATTTTFADTFDADLWLEVDWCDFNYEADPFYCDEVYALAFG